MAGESVGLVVIVEDDAETLGLLERALTYAHLSVLSADSLRKALDLLGSSHPDLVISDMGLPDGSGLDVLRYLRSKGNPVPFIFLTARGDLESKLEAFKAGAQDYIQKPFIIEELLARVNVHLPLQNSLKTSRSKELEKEINEEIISRVQEDMLDATVHDLKVPLASIKGSLDIINSRGLVTDEKVSQLLAHAGESANYMLLMLNNMLDISRYEEKGLKIQIQRVSLPDVTQKLETLFEGICLRRQVKIIHDFEPGLDKLRTDPNLFLRILANLTSNAVEFSPKGGVVEIRGQQADAMAVFSVLDRGPGLTQSVKENLFKKYAVGSQGASREVGGAGIGLAFCKIAVDVLGGNISGENRPGGGSVFTVRIPLNSDSKSSSCLLTVLSALIILATVSIGRI